MNLELILRNADEHLTEAESSDNEGHFEIAAYLYGKAIDIDPKDPVAYGHRGYAFNSLGRFDEAVADLTMVIDIDPKHHPAAYGLRGNSYRLMGEKESAERDYRTALGIFNETPKKKIDDYRWAIRAERGLVKLGVITENPIEQSALEKGIVTKEQLALFYQHEK